MNLYSVKDTKVQAFGTPFSDKHNMTAMRGFQTVAKDPKSMYSKFPQDFELWKLAEFNEETGHIKMCAELIMTCVDAIGVTDDK